MLSAFRWFPWFHLVVWWLESRGLEDLNDFGGLSTQYGATSVIWSTSFERAPRRKPTGKPLQIKRWPHLLQNYGGGQVVHWISSAWSFAKEPPPIPQKHTKALDFLKISTQKHPQTKSSPNPCSTFLRQALQVIWPWPSGSKPKVFHGFSLVSSGFYWFLMVFSGLVSTLYCFGSSVYICGLVGV